MQRSQEVTVDKLRILVLDCLKDAIMICNIEEDVVSL